ncbi:MAG: CPCC family cysteine-rich protein [Thermoguttaceae bacterium]
MSRHLFTVEDVFLIEGRGIVPVPGIVPQGDERFGIGDPIRLKRPDGSEIAWQIGGLELLSPLPPNKDVCVLLKGLSKGDVPIGTEIWSMNKFACPCCGYKTLDEKPPGTYDICPVCFWEDDQIQYVDPDYEGGANVVSLRQAQRSFFEFGVSDLRFKENIRAPQSGEERDPDWQPLDPAPDK